MWAIRWHAEEFMWSAAEGQVTMHKAKWLRKCSSAQIPGLGISTGELKLRFYIPNDCGWQSVKNRGADEVEEEARG